jgi:acetoacetate decarboxylase
MGLGHDEGWCTPPDSPLYPPPPAVYRNVKFQVLLFRARVEAVRPFLPEPLEAAPDGMCMAAGLEIPFCSSYGPFLEAFLQFKCAFRGQEGYYCSHVFHNGPAGIAAGREIYGTPKLYSDLSVRYEDRAMTTEARLGGMRVLRLSTFTAQAISSDLLPSFAPLWRLKCIPRADGPGPALKQLIDGSKAAHDATVHFCARGTGVLSPGASPFLDLTPLQPVAYGEAYYFETSYSESYAEIVYDYLAEAASRAET